MNLSDNEKYLRDLLGDGTEDLDMEALWDAVEPRLEKKENKKKRGIIFWFFGAGLLFLFMGITAVIFWYEKEDFASNKTTSSIINQHAKDNPIEKHDLNNSLPQIQNNYEENDSQMEDNEIGLLENQTERKAKTLSSSISSQRNKYDVNFYNLKSGYNPSNLLENKSGNISPYLNSEENNWGMNNSKFEIIQDEEIDQVSDVVNDEIASFKEDEVREEISEGKEEDESVKKNKRDKDEVKDKKKKKKKKNRRKKRKEWYPYFYSSASIAYSARMMTPKKTDEARDLFSIRNQYENSLESYQFGFNFKFINDRNGLILNVGSNYENITEHLKYQEEIIETETIPVITSVIVDGAGNLLEERAEMIEVTTIRKRDVSIYNHYRFFNIQLGLGYKIEKKKFNLECEAGLDVNLFFKPKGYAFNNDLEVVSLSETIKGKAVKPSMWTSLTLDYPLNDHASVVGSAYLKYRGSITKDNYSIKHKYLSPGLSVGMKFLIF